MSKKLYHMSVVIEGEISVEAETLVEATQLAEEKVQDSLLGEFQADYIEIELNDTEDSDDE